MQENPKVGFLIMNMARQLWRGRALWKDARTEGPEYEMYNDKPMYRYNSYFGINTVHYLDLVEAGFQESLPLHAIIPASILTKLVRNRFKTARQGNRSQLLVRRAVQTTGYAQIRFFPQ